MLKKFFKLEQFKTDVRTEILAGATTFMAMSYILAVQPALMNAAGMDMGAIVVVTALVAGIFSIFMGLYTNLPFALAPGMGSNAVFAFTLVAGGIASWQVGLGMTFISGMVFLLMTLLGIRDLVVKMIPKTIKLAIGAAVGIFIARLGLSSAKLMVINNNSISIGDFKQPEVLLATFGLVLVSVLIIRKVKGSLFITIGLVTLISIAVGMTALPDSFSLVPPSIMPVAFKLDIAGALDLKLFPIMFGFFIGDFFSTLGTLLGVSKKAGLLDKNGDLPNIQKPFLVDATATVVGAVLGATVVTTFVESSAGVEEGGRTGLTAVTTGVLFLFCIFLAPIALLIPPAATAPILVLIGISMFINIKDIEFDDMSNTIPALLTVFFTAFAGGLGNGITMGILSYLLLKLFSGKYNDIHFGLYFLAIPLILQYII